MAMLGVGGVGVRLLPAGGAGPSGRTGSQVSRGRRGVSAVRVSSGGGEAQVSEKSSSEKSLPGLSVPDSLESSGPIPAVTPSFKRDEPLTKHNTWEIGGPAALFLEVSTLLEMRQAMVYFAENSTRWMALGKGSNSLFDDRGYDGCVVLNRVDFLETDGEGTFRAGAGYDFNKLGALASKLEWSGLEFGSGIPGAVGGAVFMNAGANGQETVDTLVSVEVVDSQGNYRVLSREELLPGFGYRTSPFQAKSSEWIIYAATFKLSAWDGARAKQMELMAKRRKTQPVASRSCGCVFQNPAPGVPAGKLIDDLGLKGWREGGAEVSEVHGNFVVNAGGSTARDVLKLVERLKAKVLQESGYELHEEIRFVPYSSE